MRNNRLQHVQSRRRLAVVPLVLAVGLAACGGGDGEGSETTIAPGATTTSGDTVPDLSDQCPLDALESAEGPVEITYWHAMTRANEETLTTLTDEFNASQDKVAVTLVNQNGYTENFTAFETAFNTNDSPDLIQLEDTSLQKVVDAQAVVPAQACLDAADATKDDFVKRVVDYYSIDGTLYPMPFNVSNPVFYYNKKSFEAAGLDPEQAPTTFAEVREYADALQGSGIEYGFAFKRDAWVLEQFLALNGEPYVNNDNGRSGRATAAAFDTDTALEIFEFLDSGQEAGVFVTNPAGGPSGFDNLINICKGTVPMTIDTSAALGTAYDVLQGEGCDVEVEIGVAPLPGGNGNGGVLVGGAANFLPANGDDVRLAAAYTYAAFLASPESQATWAAGTGYIPVSRAAADSDTIQSLWADKPGYKVAFDQLVSGVDNVATAGPVIGDYKGVRDAMTDALEAFLVESTSPADALADAKRDADQRIQAYNDGI